MKSTIFENKTLGKILEFIKADKGKKFLIIAGIAALLLIFISDFLPKGQTTNIPASTTLSSSEYIASLEKKLTDVITNISGVGQSTVMVTLESGTEYVYANEERKNTDKTTEGYSDDQGTRTQERDDTEQKIIVVDGVNGGKQALVRTEIEPKIKGVVIVCEGGDQALVQQRVINAVTTVLNISSRRVCVTRLS